MTFFMIIFIYFNQEYYENFEDWEMIIIIFPSSDVQSSSRTDAGICQGFRSSSVFRYTEGLREEREKRERYSDHISSGKRNRNLDYGYEKVDIYIQR